MNSSSKDISLQLVAATIRKHGWQLALCAVASGLVVFLFMLSIPDYFRSDEIVGYEEESSTIAEGLRQVGLSMGFDTGRQSPNTDAFFPPHYILLLESQVFLAQMLKTTICTEEGDSMTYYAYLRDNQQTTWWQTLYNRVSGWGSEPASDDIFDVDPTHLTPSQEVIFELAAERILCQANTKKNLVTVSVIDRDPYVCATMAAAVCRGIRDFVEEYRRQKMSEQILFYDRLVQQATDKYLAARRAFEDYAQPRSWASKPSSYTWSNHLRLRMMQEQTTLHALRSHYDYSVSRLSEPTSLFAPVQQASIPVEPRGPRRLTSALLTSLLSLIVVLLYFLREPLIQQLK